MRKCLTYLFEILLLICIMGCPDKKPYAQMDSLERQLKLAQRKQRLKQTDKVQFSDEEYVLQSGDRLDIKFYYNPELNETVTIRPDGRISLQLIEEVRAAGITAAELDKILTERYSQRLRYAEVGVIVSDFASLKVYVGGEINSPGAISLEGRMSALQAIIHAGGYKETAEMSSVVILRNDRTEKPVFKTLDLRKDLESGKKHNDVILEPHDIIFVPKSKIAKLNQFIEQYVDQLVPAALSFGLVYNLNPELEIKQ